MTQVNSRRRFLKECGVRLSSLLAAGSVLAGCRENTPKQRGETKPVNPCDDLSGISENDLKARKNLNYVEVGALKNKTCAQCNLFIPPKPGHSCGGCMLFKGPVRSEGACTYWAAKAEG